MAPGGASHSTLTTRWSMIDRCGGTAADDGWRWFIDRYRPAIRQILTYRLSTSNAEAALDEFWAYLWDSDALAVADRGRRFRTFLGGIVRNFAHEWLRSHRRLTSDADPADIASATAQEDDTELRAWADNLLAIALERLRSTHPEPEQMLRWFYGIGERGAQQPTMRIAEIRERVGKSKSAVEMALHRARTRLHDLLIDELRSSVSDQEALDEELALLRSCIERERPGVFG